MGHCIDSLTRLSCLPFKHLRSSELLIAALFLLKFLWFLCETGPRLCWVHLLEKKPFEIFITNRRKRICIIWDWIARLLISVINFYRREHSHRIIHVCVSQKMTISPASGIATTFLVPLPFHSTLLKWLKKKKKKTWMIKEKQSAKYLEKKTAFGAELINLSL